MNKVILGEGNIFGKGVYADRDFKRGEVVIRYKCDIAIRDIKAGEQVTADATKDNV